MAELSETPQSSRVRIAFFGLRNAGKSTLVNAFTGQDVAIVSDTPGTTTDPVSKAMEILPLGPCLITDTAGLDDEGALGRQRVERTLRVLETTDIAVWVAGGEGEARLRKEFLETCARLKVRVLVYDRGDSVDALKRQIAALKLEDETPGLLDGLVGPGDHVVCVCPIDESAPKGRLILPQVQLLRDCLDRHATASVCQVGELEAELRARAGKVLVVTDSQAFGEVESVLSRVQGDAHAAHVAALTSFSILFARQKGDLASFCAGVDAAKRLRDGDMVLVAEGCTHHRQCNDIGTVKIPKALERLSGRRLRFRFSSGASFPDLSPDVALVVHCGGCMLARREMMRRIACARAAGVPVVNYGLLLAAAVDPCRSVGGFGIISPDAEQSRKEN